MSDTILLPSPDIGEVTALSKWEREFQAFHRLLPQLLRSHRGEFVAIHNEDVVDSGNDRVALATRVLQRVGNVDIHIGLVSEAPAPISRSGLRRELAGNIRP